MPGIQAVFNHCAITIRQVKTTLQAEKKKKKKKRKKNIQATITMMNRRQRKKEKRNTNKRVSVLVYHLVWSYIHFLDPMI